MSSGQNPGTWTSLTSFTTNVGGLNVGSYQYQLNVTDGLGGKASKNVTVTVTPSAPSAPQNLQATKNSDNISLTWDNPISNGGIPITNYKIYRGTTPETKSLLTTVGNVNTYNDTAISLGTTYYYNVTAVNAFAEGPASNDVMVIYILPPSAPRDLTLTPGNQQIRLDWTAPEFTNGGAITAYTIYRSTDPGTTPTFLISVGNVLTYTDDTPALTNGQNYYYQVTANNSAGESPRSDKVSVYPRTTPSEPLNVAVTPADGINTISWTAPSNNGGSAITGYVIYNGTISGAESYLTTVTESPYVHTGLTNGVEYFYVIAAVNVAGTGTNSTRVSGIPVTNPSVPQNFAAVIGNQQINLTWEVPLTDGGLPITSYTLYRSTAPGAESFYKLLGNQLSYNETGLTNGVTYYYKIYATNTAGKNSTFASVSAAPKTTPAAPLNVQATSGLNQITLTWNAPNDGGTPITNYLIYAGPISGGESLNITLGNVLSYVFTSLTEPTTLYFLVQANNSVGLGPNSTRVSATPQNPPSMPQNFALNPRNGQIELTWSTPLSDGGSTITGYKIYRGVGTDQTTLLTTTGVILSYTDSGLTNGLTYYYNISAINANGESPITGALNTYPRTVPTAPQTLQAIRGNELVTLTWLAPSSDGGSAILNYSIYSGPSAGSLTFLRNASAEEPHTAEITGLTNGQTYYFKITAVNIAGESLQSNLASAIPATTPSAPQNFAALSGRNANVPLSWNQPVSDGGSAIINYTIYRGTVSGTHEWLTNVSASTFEYLDTAVTNEITYYYVIGAYNQLGYGTNSTEISATPENLYPSEPTSVQVTATGDKSVSLSWTAPSNTGNSAIRNYKIYRGTSVDSLVWHLNTTADETSIVDTVDLTNGVKFYYKISAVNLNYYEGTNSSMVEATPYGIPSEPLNLNAVPGNNQVYLSWDLPSDNGGSAILYYRIYRATTSNPTGVLTTTSDATREFLDTTAQNGQIYYYKVSAVTVVGEGSKSDEVSTTPLTTPGVVQNLATTPQNTQINLTWNAPANNGGSPITYYHIFGGSVSGGEPYLATVPASQRYYLVTGLTNGQTYYFIVLAQNAAGNGTNSTQVNDYPRTTPDAPTNLQVAEGNAQLSLTWTPPANNGGAAILRYIIYRGASAGSVTYYDETADATAQFLDTGVSNGIAYFYKIAAVNIAGEGPLSDANSGVPKTTPFAPLNLRIDSVGDQTITLKWDAPSSDGGSAITNYRIYSSATLMGTYILIGTVGNVLTYQNTSLINGQIYYFKVKAVNIVGEGLFSNAVSDYPRTTPSAPQNLATTAGDQSVLLTWTAPYSNGGATITGYHIYGGLVSGSEGYLATVPASQFYFNQTGLTNGDLYYFIVAATNVAGNGTNSTQVSAIPCTVPGAITNLNWNRGNRAITLTWSAPDDGGNAISSYNIYRGSDSGNVVFLVNTGNTDLSYLDSGLNNGQSYFYQVSANNSVGEGPLSNKIEAIPATVPDAPLNLIAVAGNSHVNLTWQAPSSNGGDAITNYKIYRGETSGGQTLLTTVGVIFLYSDETAENGHIYYYNVTAVNTVGESAHSIEVMATPAVDFPSAPQNVQAQYGNAEITLTWNHPADYGIGADWITKYRIYRSTSSGMEVFLKETDDNATSTVDGSLTNGIQYYYKISAVNNLGKEGPLSSEVSAIPRTVPNPPTGLQTTYGNGQITISWVAPLNDGGSSLTGYNIYRSITSGSGFAEIASVGVQLSYLDSTTVNGQTYYYYVTARNSEGQSSPSAEVWNISRTVPSAPINVQATYGNANVTLTWEAPATGGAALTSYNIYRGTQSGMESFLINTGNTNTQYVDTGLTNGVTYYYKVSANNSEGEGALSTETSATPKTVPSAPTNFALDAGDEQILLTWNAPITNGGAPITNYRIYRGTLSGQLSLLTTVGNLSSYVDTGLTNEQTYYYCIVAVNIVGDGANSSELSAKPQSVFPTEPLNVQTAYASNQVTLTWTQPGYFGAPSILYYRIYRGTTAGSESFLINTTDATPQYVDNFVENGITYYYRISAVNSLYYEGIKSTTVSIMPRTVPTAPQSLNAQFGNQNVTLTWSIPENNGGLEILYYAIYQGTTSGGETWLTNTTGASLSYMVTGLTNGLTYYYKVRAVNAEGLSAYSNEASAIPKTVPGAPLNPSAVPGNNQVSLSWNTPSSNGGASITNYRIYRQINGGSSSLLVTIGTLTSYTDFDVSNGNLYEYNITAVNAAGEGPVSAEVSAIPRTVPSAPQNVQASFGNAQIQLTWTAPSSNGGAAIQYYRIYRGTSSGSETFLVNTIGAVTTYLDESLTNGQIYFYKITAVNIAGESTYSNEVSAIPRTVPTAPLNLIAAGGNAQVNLTWSVPASNGGTTITGYNIYRGTESGNLVFLFDVSGSVTTALDTFVVNGINYIYKVAAVNEIGEGSNSTEVSAMPLTNPSSPENLNAVRGNQQVSLSWSAPSSNGGLYIANYTVYWGLSAGAENNAIPLSNNNTNYIHTGLTNGQTYYYKVTATNFGNRTSVKSTGISAVPATVPTAPLNLNAQAGYNHVNLTWSVPNNNGGSAITGYKIYRENDGDHILLVSLGVVYFYEDTTAENDKIYYYNVTAINDVGESAYSNQVMAEPKVGLPTAPLNLQATPGNNNVTLTWDAPENDGGSALLKYRIYRGESSGMEVFLINTTDVTPREYVDSTALNGILYYYRISAVNIDEKEGPLSNEISARPAWVPFAPTLSAATAGNKSVWLEWSDTGITNGDSVLYYKIYRGTSSNSEVFLTNTATNATNYNDTAVLNGQTYYYKIAAVNSIGESSLSNELSALPKDIPSAPLNPSATPGNQQVSLAWSAPTSTGGVPLTQYKIFMGTTSGAEELITTVSAAQTTYLKSGLINGQIYYFVIAAVNTAGTGPNSTQANAIPRTIPAAPGDVTIVAGNAHINLTWVTPDNGGSAITGYKIYRGLSTGTAIHYATIGVTNTYTDSGLTNGLTYYYQILATNIVGDGPLSPEVSATPVTNPSAVLSPIATRADSSVTLTWQAPASTGGVPILHYRIYRGTTSGSLTWLKNTTNVLTTDDTGLTNGVLYYYAISAVNDFYKEGPLSVEVSVRPATVPDVPQNFNLEAGNLQVSLSWNAPASNGGEPITNYAVYRGLASDTLDFLTFTGNVTYYLDIVPLNDQEYFYLINAINVIGNSSNSSIKSAIPMNDYPGEPLNLIAYPGRSNVSLAWDEPSSMGSGAFSYYRIYRGTSPGSLNWLTNTVAQLYNDTNVANGTQYYYQVSAVNTNGEGGRSLEVSAIPRDIPAAPLNFQATGGNNVVTLSWNVPISNGGTPITQYFIYRGEISGSLSLLTTVGAVTTYVDTWVSNGQTYYYQISANNSVGEGPLTAEVSAIPRSVPSAPLSLLATAGDLQVSLSWTVPADNGGASITGYRIYRSLTPMGSQTLIAEIAPITTYTDYTVTNGIEYWYNVSAVNIVGEGLQSEGAQATPVGEASAPQNFAATAGNQQVALTWTTPADLGGRSLIGYNLYRSTTSGIETLYEELGVQTDYLDTNLINGIMYYYRVRAVTTGNTLGNASVELMSKPNLNVTFNVKDLANNNLMAVNVTLLENNIPFRVQSGLTDINGNVTFTGLNNSDWRILINYTWSGAEYTIYNQSSYITSTTETNLYTNLVANLSTWILIVKDIQNEPVPDLQVSLTNQADPLIERNGVTDIDGTVVFREVFNALWILKVEYALGSENYRFTVNETNYLIDSTQLVVVTAIRCNLTMVRFNVLDSSLNYPYSGLNNANVTVQSPTTGANLTSLYTNSMGIIETRLPLGMMNYSVQYQTQLRQFKIINVIDTNLYSHAISILGMGPVEIYNLSVAIGERYTTITPQSVSYTQTTWPHSAQLLSIPYQTTMYFGDSVSIIVFWKDMHPPTSGVLNDSISDWYSWSLRYNGVEIDNSTISPLRILNVSGEDGNYSWVFNSNDYGLAGTYILSITVGQEGYQTASMDMTFSVLNYTTSLVKLTPDNQLVVYWNTQMTIRVNYTSILPEIRDVSSANLYWVIDGQTSPELMQNIGGTGIFELNWTADLAVGVYMMKVYGNATNYAYKSIQFLIQIIAQTTTLTITPQSNQSIGLTLIKAAYGENWSLLINYTDGNAQGLSGSTILVYIDNQLITEVYPLGNGLWLITRPASANTLGNHELRIVVSKPQYTPRTAVLTLQIKSSWATDISLITPPALANWGDTIEFEVYYFGADAPRTGIALEGATISQVSVYYSVGGILYLYGTYGPSSRGTIWDWAEGGLGYYSIQFNTSFLNLSQPLLFYFEVQIALPLYQTGIIAPYCYISPIGTQLTIAAPFVTTQVDFTQINFDLGNEVLVFARYTVNQPGNALDGTGINNALVSYLIYNQTDNTLLHSGMMTWNGQGEYYLYIPTTQLGGYRIEITAQMMNYSIRTKTIYYNVVSDIEFHINIPSANLIAPGVIGVAKTEPISFTIVIDEAGLTYPSIQIVLNGEVIPQSALSTTNGIIYQFEYGSSSYSSGTYSLQVSVAQAQFVTSTQSLSVMVVDVWPAAGEITLQGEILNTWGENLTAIVYYYGTTLPRAIPLNDAQITQIRLFIYRDNLQYTQKILNSESIGINWGYSSLESDDSWGLGFYAIWFTSSVLNLTERTNYYMELTIGQLYYSVNSLNTYFWLDPLPSKIEPIQSIGIVQLPVNTDHVLEFEYKVNDAQNLAFGQLIRGADVTYEIRRDGDLTLVASGALTQTLEGRYRLAFNSGGNAGEFTVNIFANIENHTSATYAFSLEVKFEAMTAAVIIPTDIRLGPNSLKTSLAENVTLWVNLTVADISGVTITVNESQTILPYLYLDSPGYYRFTLPATSLGLGQHILIIRAEKANYVPLEIQISVTVVDLWNTVAELTRPPTILPWNSNVSFTFRYLSQEDPRIGWDLNTANITQLNISVYNNGDFTLIASLENAQIGIVWGWSYIPATTGIGVYNVWINTSYFPIPETTLLYASARLNQTIYRPAVIAPFFWVRPVATVTTIQTPTIIDAKREIVYISPDETTTILLDYQVGDLESQYHGTMLSAALVSYQLIASNDSVISNGNFVNLGNGRYGLNITGNQQGNYSLVITAQYLNFSTQINTVRVVVEPRQITMVLSSTMSSTPIQIKSSTEIVILFNATDYRTGRPITGAKMIYWINEQQYQAIESEDVPGQYRITINNAMLKQLPQARLYQLRCAIEKDNYETEYFDIYLNIGYQVDPVLNVPYYYWMIGLISAGAFAAMIGGYRVYRIAKTPIFVRRIQSIQSIMSKNKLIKSSKLAPSFEEYLVAQFGADWKAFGLDLGGKFGIKQNGVPDNDASARNSQEGGL
jgi:fibronectin type 3 domain-containing protein